MAGVERMTIDQVIRKVLGDEHAERGGRQAPTGLSRHLKTDELSAPLLHHDPGLDFVEPPQMPGRR